MDQTETRNRVCCIEEDIILIFFLAMLLIIGLVGLTHMVYMNCSTKQVSFKILQNMCGHIICIPVYTDNQVMIIQSMKIRMKVTICLKFRLQTAIFYGFETTKQYDTFSEYFHFNSISIKSYGFLIFKGFVFKHLLGT